MRKAILDGVDRYLENAILRPEATLARWPILGKIIAVALASALAAVVAFVANAVGAATVFSASTKVIGWLAVLIFVVGSTATLVFVVRR